MSTGSCAAEHYEPRQIREEAAVNSSFWVPQVYLVGACGRDKPVGVDRQRVHDPLNVIATRGGVPLFRNGCRITAMFNHILGG